jgi:hypothetical protein
MKDDFKKTGMVRNVKFLIKDENTVMIWKPKTVELYDFKIPCQYIMKYLVDENFITKKEFTVEIVT